MTYQDAIKKINKLLGLYKFNSYKLADGTGELVSDSTLSVGEPIYIITDNGQLPAPEGEFELEDTTKIKVKDGLVHEIKYDMEKKQFTEATLKDGTVVKSPTFDIGEDISVVSPDGKESPAPDGEHELALKDSEGKDVVFRVIVKDGKITERENIEESNPEDMGMIDGMTPGLSSGNDITDEAFKNEIMAKVEAIMKKIEEMASNYEDMKSKVSKFSKEPAGDPIKQPNNLISELKEQKSDYISQLIKIRATSTAKK
jgi:hypothetical protein